MDTYYHPKDLARFAEMGEEAPELWQKFLEWYNAVFAEGALTEREKALIALGVAHAVQCPYCIDAYSTACLEKGSDAGADDRGGPRRGGDPRRRVARPRRADAEPRRQAVDVAWELQPDAWPISRHTRWRDTATQRAPLACAAAGAVVRGRAAAAAGHDPLRTTAIESCRSTSASAATRPAATATSTPAPTARGHAAGRRRRVPALPRAERHPDRRHHRRRAGAAPALPRLVAAPAPPAGT